jgi:hypothetical protein
MDDERDRDFVGAAHAGVMIADIAKDESDLVEIVEMINELRLLGRRSCPVMLAAAIAL